MTYWLKIADLHCSVFPPWNTVPIIDFDSRMLLKARINFAVVP